LIPRIALAAVLLGLAANVLAAGTRTVRGPMEARDEFLLAQSLLTLPPMGASLTPPGRTDVRLDGDWGNDFGLETAPGNPLANLRFFVDGEHRTAALTVRRGFGARWAAGVRVPVHWRGGGWLDTIIDPFHRFFGFPDSGRPLYAQNRLRVEARTPERQRLDWTGGPGTGLGSVELEIGRTLRDGAAGGPAIALFGYALLPTSTGTFADGGRGAGAQAVLSQPLGRAFDLHAGGGGTALGPEERDGLACARSRGFGFAALEWRPVAAWSVLAQWEASSRLVTDVDHYPGLQLSLRIGSKVDAGRWRLEAGFLEGIKDLDATTDFGVFAAVARRF
jgi:hypothetical protein